MNTFPKIEKLCGQIRIQTLYREGRKLTVWPLRVTYCLTPTSRPTKTEVLLWAPKSLFKHAVDRNRIRRQMREAYRLNKDQVEDKGWEIAINYMDKQALSFGQIEKAMKRVLKRIQEEEDKLR